MIQMLTWAGYLVIMQYNSFEGPPWWQEEIIEPLIRITSERKKTAGSNTTSKAEEGVWPDLFINLQMTLLNIGGFVCPKG